jgi:hypothetical protein
MAESIRYFEGDQITCHANVALTGARFCGLVADAASGNPIVGLPSGSGGIVFGVNATDALSGDEVVVWSKPGQIVWVEAGTGGLTALDVVQTSATGTAITRTSGLPAGICIQGASAGSQALIKLQPALV